jgi:hypothetical protein
MNRSNFGPLRFAFYVYILIILLASLALGGTQPIVEILPNAPAADDTPQIQAAIDLVRATTDQPGGDGAHGGTVRLGRGVFLIQTPIKLYAGVHLVGAGPGTALACYTDGVNVIELDNRPGGGFIIGQAAVRNLRIVHYGATSGSCIKRGTAQQILDCLFEDLRLASPGKALDFDGGYTQACQFVRVSNDHNPGLGNSLMSWDGNVNNILGGHVHSLVQNGAFATFVNGRPIYDLKGANCSIRDVTIEPQFPEGRNGYCVNIDIPNAQPASAFTWDNIHLEPGISGSGTITGGNTVKLKDTYFRADNVSFLGGTKGKLDIGSNTLATIRVMESLGPMKDVITLNDSSFLRVDMPMASNDVGWLDKKNVSFGDALNRTAGTFVPSPPKLDGQNLVKHAPSWQIVTAGGATFSTISQESGSRTLSINVTAAPGGSTITVTVPLRDSGGTVGRWKVTVPTGAVYGAYTDGMAQTIRAVAQGTRTAAVIPVETKTVVFQFTSLATGTYTIDEMLVGDLVIE